MTNTIVDIQKLCADVLAQYESDISKLEEEFIAAAEAAQFDKIRDRNLSQRLIDMIGEYQIFRAEVSLDLKELRDRPFRSTLSAGQTETQRRYREFQYEAACRGSLEEDEYQLINMADDSASNSG